MKLVARRLTPTRLSLPHTTRKPPATDPRLPLIVSGEGRSRHVFCRERQPSAQFDSILLLTALPDSSV